MKLIPLEKCIERRVYKLNCRNLSYGAYNGNGGFIGIRTKFRDRFLFAEIHYDASDHFGTVRAMEDTYIDVPKDIDIRENDPTIDKSTGKVVYFDGVASKGGRGWVFKDTNEESMDIYPIAHINRKLFKFLENIEENEKDIEV